MDEATLTLRSERRARIVVGNGSLSLLPRLAAGLDSYMAVVVHDPGIPGGLVARVRRGLEEAGLRTLVHPARRGEEAKTIEAVVEIWEFLARAGATRDTLLVAVGGGGVLDAAGFAAATYMRGVKLAYVPTTTLAQADAAIGGKTAIDAAGVKNLVGAFYHPDLVVVDPSILAGAPEEAYTPGFAEVVKHAAIKGREWVEWLRSKAPGVKARDPRVLEEVVKFSVSVKLEVVERDYTEAGYRAVLNFGHTIGHAVEAASGYRIPHGYAVSVGLNAESRMAVELTGLPEEEAGLLAETLRAFGLPLKAPPLPGDPLAALRLDKKFRRGKPRLPLPRRLGDFEIVEVDWGVLESWVPRLIPTRGSAA
ncbi:3-dehydroquinate synthase [Stetteria hydrogenophila]